MASLSTLLTLKTRTTISIDANSKSELAQVKCEVANHGLRSKTIDRKDEYVRYEVVVSLNVEQALDIYGMPDLAYSFCDLPEFEGFTYDEIDKHIYQTLRGNQ